MTLRQRVSQAALLCSAAAVLATGAACSSSQDPEGAAATTAAGVSGPTAAGVRHLAAADFAELIKQPGTVVLDVRTPAEFATGHISGAVNLDMQAADFTTRLGELDKASGYALYCHSGRRSALAAEQMRSAGFATVADLAGGVGSWTAAGLPLVTT